MSNGEVDHSRRRLLTGTAGVVGGVGVACVATPFVASMQPSARTTAAGAPVEIDLSDIEPGELRVVEWRRKPVWILRRSEEELEQLKSVPTGELKDPDSANSEQPPYVDETFRSIKPEFLVMVGICTHLGCSPTFRPEAGAPDIGADWKGGFLCPCHGGRYDMAGRVYKGVPPPLNMAVPPHRYLDDNRLLIGEDEEVA